MSEASVSIKAPRYVLIPVAAQTRGFTAKAIRRKMESGVWVEGREYRKGPDGRIYIDNEGVDRWVERCGA